MVLSEHVVEAKAEADADIMAAVSKLVEALAKERAGGTSSVHIQATMTGGIAGVVGAQNVSVGSMNVEAQNPTERLNGGRSGRP